MEKDVLENKTPSSSRCSGVLISTLALSTLNPADLMVVSAGTLPRSDGHSFLPAPWLTLQARLA